MSGPGPGEMMERLATKEGENAMKDPKKDQVVGEKKVEAKTMPAPKKTAVVIIKHGGVETKVQRDHFINVQETSDGLVFNFTNGMHLVYTNQYMTIPSKVRITAANRIDKGSMLIDLDNPNKPIKIEL